MTSQRRWGQVGLGRAEGWTAELDETLDGDERYGLAITHGRIYARVEIARLDELRALRQMLALDVDGEWASEMLTVSCARGRLAIILSAERAAFVATFELDERGQLCAALDDLLKEL